MLNSGLMKLAAMIGVIGVGLVAVYQAQQGLKPTSVVATPGDDTAEESDATTTESETAENKQNGPSLGAMASVSPEADEEKPLELANPFEISSKSQKQTTSQESDSKSKSTARKPKSKTPVRTADSSASAEPLDADITNAEVAAPNVDAKVPVLDFRDDPTPTGPALKSTPIQQTGFEGGEPNRLPDEADPFELNSTKKTPAAKSASNSGQPRVRLANETQPASDVSSKSTEADPFDGSKPEVIPPTEPAKSEPNPFEEMPDLSSDKKADPDFGSAPPATEPAPKSEEEPFGSTPLPEPAPATPPPSKELPEKEDPFGGSNPVPPPATPSGKGTDEADPFGGSNAPPSLPPLADDLPSPSGKTPSQPEVPAPKGNSPRPSLPTSIPESNEVPVDLDKSVPLEDRKSNQPKSNRSRGDDGRPPSQDDLIGDGTVTDSAPRGLQQPRLTIEKIAPKQAVLGEPLIYTVIVKNVGGSAANNVVVEDRIPKGTELTGTAPQADLVDKKLIWQLGTLKPDDEAKISIRVIPRQEGPVGSVARVSFSAEVAAEIVIAAPQLGVKVKAPQEVRVGEVFEMIFVVKNSGGAPAKNVSLRDVVPEGLKHEAGTDIECPIGLLGPNESREVALQVTATKPGRVKNLAMMRADGGIAQDLDSVIDVIGEHLVLTRSGHGRIYAERPALYKCVIKNEGNAAVQSVKVSEVVPIGFEFLEASEGGRFDSATRTIHWTVGPLAPGAETEVATKLVGKTPGVLAGKITATGSAGSSASVSSEVEVVGRPELQMETLSATGLVAVGDKLTSKIQLKNTGSATARNVGLSITIPKELKLIEVRGARYLHENNVVRFEPLEDLAPGKAARFELVMDAVAEANATMDLRISADHLSRPAQRTETVHISSEFR